MKGVAIILAGVLLATVGPYAYIAIFLIISGSGSSGETLFVAEAMRQQFPSYFEATVSFLSWLQGAENTYAVIYYEEQRPLLLKALESFTLHPYFVNADMPDSSDWKQLLHARMKHFRKYMEQHGRVDYYVEKDRCEMYRFYRGHGLPLLPIHGVWRDLDTLLAAVRDRSAFANVSASPTFWKACHLTQSSSYATRAMSKLPTTPEEIDELVDWLTLKWHFRANDVDRVWTEDGNALTDNIPPGFLLQAPFEEPFTVKGRIAIGLPEVRVEVLWGRAYLALLDGVVMLLRNDHHQDFGDMRSMRSTPKLQSGHWFFTEGHDRCVWATVETAAFAAGADSMRVDVFLNRARPAECIMNENSLSSGLVYWGHEDFMARLWAEPHVRSLYRVRDTQVSVLEQ